MYPLRIGTRSSLLATAQTAQVQKTMRDVFLLDTQQVLIQTGSVRRRDGSFVAALRTALLEGECDLAVHSLKDIPIAPHEGTLITAVLPREDPCDVLCARKDLTLTTLPSGAKVGTASARRRAQILNFRPDLDVVSLRGNIDKRLIHLDTLDAIVLSAAGLKRIDREDAITESFDIHDWPTAAGQGSLAIEVCTAQLDDPQNRVAVTYRLDNPMARVTTTAERGVLSLLQADCFSPIAVHAVYTANDKSLRLHAKVFSRDGKIFCESIHFARLVKQLTDTNQNHTKNSGRDDIGNALEVAMTLAETVVDELLSKNAREILKQ